MPGSPSKKWYYTNTVGKFRSPGSLKRAITRLKAAYRGRKVRKQWYAGYKGYLHKGRFTYN